jgi:hypothetical protein
MKRYYADYDYECPGDALQEANREIARLAKHISDMEDVFIELRDYFDQRADAELFIDGPLPNEEMKLLCMIDEVL